MTTTTLEKPLADANPADPYVYGWRYIRHEQADGNFYIEEVPLTLADVLYPQEGDQVTHSKMHQQTVKYLVNVLEARLAHDPAAAVLDDVRVAWDVPELRPNGPDIAVVFGVRTQRNWSTFDVAEEGVRPALIIEVTSPETRGIDIVNKVEIFAQAGVAQYIIVDVRQWKGVDTLYLLGYQLTPRGYEVLAPDEAGRFWIEPVGIWIGLRDNRVTCFDAAGEPIGDYPEVDAARAEAETRAETAETRAAAEAEARMQAEARLRELEAEMRRLRGEG
jgi:Uma2 family endonuclease